ncbi:bifunctional nuclease family protein [Rhabdothermincola sp. EGI L10124]|nr:bifunctional nuclease family protein [Rhabdothermincola salaria]MCD9623102.1 bifunctional nuclease family protein [Rhabdothermincola salaria]
MELVAVRIELPGNIPVVVLREREGEHRLLPIFIGQPEAAAIAFALDGVVTQRPMTHDLMRDVVAELGAVVERVVITHLEEGTFYADLHLQTGDRRVQVSSRPSDAMALALRVECPIFATEELLDEAGLPEEVDEDGDEAGGEDVVEQFREFIDSVNPDDFAS